MELVEKERDAGGGRVVGGEREEYFTELYLLHRKERASVTGN